MPFTLEPIDGSFQLCADDGLMGNVPSPKSPLGKCKTSEHPRSLWQGGAIQE
jgi:hypothetical protein